MLNRMINKFLIMNGVELKQTNQGDRSLYLLQKCNNLADLELSSLDSESLSRAAEFLGINYVSGTNIISTLFRWAVNLPFNAANLYHTVVQSKKRVVPKHWIFNYEIKLNGILLERIKRKLIYI